MSPLNMTIVARKELRDALRNRWFLLYAVAFAVLAIGLAYLSLAGADTAGVSGFGRTTAGLVNLVLLIVPLMALTTGANTLAGERERGTLAYLLTQPISRTEVLLGKYAGLWLALSAVLTLGFGASALVLAVRGSAIDATGFLTLVALSVVLAGAMLSAGMLVSALAPKASVATGVAVFLWLGLVFLSDLGLMGAAVALKLKVTTLFGLSLLNPLQVFKMSVLGTIHSSLDVLGPAGLYATRTFGQGLLALFAAALALWVLIPLGVAHVAWWLKGEA